MQEVAQDQPEAAQQLAERRFAVRRLDTRSDPVRDFLERRDQFTRGRRFGDYEFETGTDNGSREPGIREWMFGAEVAP